MNTTQDQYISSCAFSAELSIASAEILRFVHVATVGKEFLLHKLFQASGIPATALSCLGASSRGEEGRLSHLFLQ